MPAARHMSDGQAANVWRIWATLCCLAGFVAAGLVASLVFERVPHLEDEVAYLFQAQVFAAGRLYVDAPVHTNCFFAPFVLDYQGRRFGKYPPGWPALLAIGVRMGAGWWVNAACLALIAALTFRLGREARDPATGAVAAWLTVTSPFLLLLAGSLMSHTSCLLFVTAYLWFFYRACHGGGGYRWPLAAGMSLGMAFVIRPFTTVAVAFPAAVWLAAMVCRVPSRRRGVRNAWWMLLGFVPFALFVPLFNKIWTGDPFLSPYVLFWPYDRLGFGPGHGPLPEGNSLWAGLGSAVLSVGRLATHLHGWPALSLTFALALFLFKPRHPWDLFLAGVAVSLVLAYVLYWTNGSVFGPRYAHECSSALILLSAAGIVRVWRWARERKKQRQFGLLLTTLTLVSLGWYMPWQFRRYHGLYGITARPGEVLRAAELHNALVIVRDQGEWKKYAVAFAMNSPTLDGDVVYASECPSHVDELLARYRGRRVYYFDGETLYPYGEGIPKK